MKISKIKKQDLKEISELRKQTIENINAKFLPETDIQVLISMNSYKNLLWRYQYANMYYLKNNNKIIGTIDLYNNEIKGFYVHHEHIKEGIGTILLNFIEEYAKKQGHKKIKLECNESAVGFYLKKEYEIKKKKLPSGKMIKRIIYVIEKKLK